MNENVRTWEGRLTGESPYLFSRVIPFSDDEEWTRVESESLPAPVTIRVRRSTDGRWVVTGLLVGGDSSTGEISAASLRRIKVADILKHMFAGYGPDDRKTWVIDDKDFPEFIENWLLTNQIVDREEPAKSTASRNKPDEELREFANRYLKAYATQPHRAVRATQETYGFKKGTRTPILSRTTANRWLEKARSRGWVPNPKESRND